MGSAEVIGKESDGNTARHVNIRDIFFFGHTRTGSHLLCRLLSTQPGYVQSNYHFKRAFDFARESFGFGALNDVSDQHRQGFEQLIQEGFDEIMHDRRSAAAEVSRCFIIRCISHWLN